MSEVSLSEAASRLGVSVDTIRRRLRTGELPGRQVGRRLLVTIPESQAPSRRAGDELLAEVRAERDRLAALVESLNRQLESASVERAELRALLAQAMGQKLPRA